MSCRRFLPRPQEAVEQVRPAREPKSSESAAMSTSRPPIRNISSMLHPAFISFTSRAVIKGMMHSMTTSRETSMGVSMETPRYSRRLFCSSFTIYIPHFD